MAELKDKYISVLKLAKTLGCKKVKTSEENGQLVVNASCPTQYLANAVAEKAKEVDAEHKDLALKLKVETSSDLTNKYGPVYEQAYTLGCEELTLTEENGVLTVSANCPTQYNADRITDKAKKTDAEWKNSLKLDLKVQRTDIYGEHKIKADDTLEVIAKKITKNKVTPEQIFEANKDVLTDPKTLPAKTTIKIPNWDASAESEKPKKKAKEEKPATEALEVKGTEALEVKPAEEKKAEPAATPAPEPTPTPEPAAAAPAQPVSEPVAVAEEPAVSPAASPQQATREVIEKVASIVEEINTAAKAGDESEATVKTIAEKVENLVEQAKPTFVKPEDVPTVEQPAIPAPEPTVAAPVAPAPEPAKVAEPAASSPASPQQATREVIEKVAAIVEEINTAVKTGDESETTAKTIAEKVENLVEQAKPTFVQPEVAPEKEEKSATPLGSSAPTSEAKAEEKSVAKPETKKSSEEEDDDDDGDDDDDDDGDDDDDDGYDDDDDGDDDGEWEDDEDDDDGDDDDGDDDSEEDDDDGDDDEDEDDDDGDDDDDEDEDDDDGDDDDDDGDDEEEDEDDDDDDGEDDDDDDDDGEEEEKKPVDKKKSKK